MIKGKVVLVPFPFDDLSSTKLRPAVCLTEPIGHNQHIILAFITSQTPENPEQSDLVITPNDPDFANTGLRILSTIRLHRLMTVSTTIIQRELGQLSPRLLGIAETKLRILFGL